MNITARACQLGASINTRTERHGDEDVPACDIPLAGLMLNEDEVIALVGNEECAHAFFREGAEGDVPALPELHPFYLAAKLEGAKVTIAIVPAGKTEAVELELPGCKLKGIALTPLAGGFTETACRVQYAGDDVPEVVGKLLRFLNAHVSVEITDAEAEDAADSGQQDLPINRVAK